jgi:hypothetical protein
MKNTKKVKFKLKKKYGVKTTVPSKNPKVEKEVKRILDSNYRPMCNCGGNCVGECNAWYNENTDIPFISRFLGALITEAEEPEQIKDEEEVSSEVKSPDDFSPEANKKDFEKALEPETPKDAYEVQGVPPEVATKNIEEIEKWSHKLDEFTAMLNDPNIESLHKFLSDNDKAGSLLRGIMRKSSDNITRTTGELDKLKEVLNSFIITAPKKLRDTEQSLTS